MLEVKEVTKSFGLLKAINNLSLKIEEGEIVGLIGPNGAGKTTLFNLICGFYRPDSGEIRFLGQKISGLPSFKICKLGISRVHQIPKPFLNMSVIENVIVGGLYGADKDLKSAKESAMEFLDFVGLGDKADESAQTLNLIERKQLEIARSLATKPKLILLDEPLSGLNPSEVIEARHLIGRIKNELGITVFWIEHIMDAIKRTAERVIVLNFGEKIFEGTFEECVNERCVVEAYLGEEAA